MHDAFNYKFSNIFSNLYKLYSLTFSVTASWSDESLIFSVSFSPLPFFSFLFFFFFLHFWLFYLVLGSYWLLGFLLLFFLSSFLHIYIYIYICIYFKVFMGSWKLLGWLAGIGMGEVRGAQAKIQGAQAFFMKILYTKKKIFWTQGGPGPPLPSAWVRPCFGIK